MVYLQQLKIKLPVFMARSPIKAASESDVTSATEKALNFDDDTLRGEVKRVSYFPQGVNSISKMILNGTPALFVYKERIRRKP